jgi:hypothetical protein
MSKKAKAFQNILTKLNINESLTKPIRKEKVFHKVKDNINKKEDYNFGADLLFLPETKDKYIYLLVVVDLATDEFDMEPIKDKEPNTILKAFKTIIKRPYLNKPYASVRTDAGNEFLGVFQKYLYDESILKRTALPARHTQNANVESLNRQLGRLLNGYMNSKEIETGSKYKEWDEVLPIIRKELNAYRKKSESDLQKYKDKVPDIAFSVDPKFKIGDLVYRLLDTPENALGDKQSGTFREGDYRYDRQPRKIEKIVYYDGKKSPYRYLLNGLKNASFTEHQLKEAEEEEELFEVKQLLEKKMIAGKPHILTWYYGELKKEASWQPEEELLKGVPNLVKEFNEKPKKKPKKK